MALFLFHELFIIDIFNVSNMLRDSYGLVISVISFHVKTYCGVFDIGWYLLMFSLWTKTWLIYFLDKISFIYLFLYNTILHLYLGTIYKICLYLKNIPDVLIYVYIVK